MAQTAGSVPSHLTALHPRVAAQHSRGFEPAATRLTWLVAGLTLVASLAGLLIDGIYTGAASTAEMLRGYDLVTAVVVVPSIVGALHFAQQGSVRARLVTASLLAYLVYTYAYYLFGTGFNDLFLLHTAVFATALSALVLAIIAFDAAPLANQFSDRTRVRTVALVLGALASALGGMWAYFALNSAVTGDVPAGSQLVETETIVHLGMALDLSLLVPLYAVAAVLLGRRAAWGYLLATIALVAGLLHQLSYMVAMPFQVAAEIPGAVTYDPGEPVIVLLYLFATALLFRGLTRVSDRGRTR